MSAIYPYLGRKIAVCIILAGIMVAGASVRADDRLQANPFGRRLARAENVDTAEIKNQQDSAEQKGAFDDGMDGTDVFAGFDEFDDGDTGRKVFDPLKGYNRVMTQVNDRLYYLVLKPVGQGYKLILAEPARRSISRFFTNLGFPVRFVNNLLQLKIEQAATEVVRFVVNSSVGVVGLWDPATKMMGLPLYDEDFGQTLGHYGLGGGFHIVLPLLGPSNLRDACGMVADWELNPTTYISGSETALGISYSNLIIPTVKAVNSTSLRIGQYEAMTEDAVDLYIFLREAYQQNRNMQIKE